MKRFVLALVTVVTVSSAQAVNKMENPTNTDEIASARALLDLHTQNCGSGTNGWWLQLDTSGERSYESGGIYTSSGVYYGCGTCSQCRDKLNQDIDQVLTRQKQSCIQRGGEVKSENRGVWTEKVDTSSWWMNSDGAKIDCEKWITCN